MDKQHGRNGALARVIKRTGAGAIVAAAGLMGSVGVLSGTAHASQQADCETTSTFPCTSHSSFDPTGAVFTCQSGDLTVTGGTVDMVEHTNIDAQGVFHFTGTITPHDVTLVDAAGSTYTLSGASWFGGKGTEQQTVVEHDTDHFVLHDPSGGVFGKVQLVDHFNVSQSGINGFTFDKGSCETPQD